MHKQKFTITLQEQVVISQRPAILGGHSSLDYLPGATLLGACAARLYKKLSKENAYTVFYSGKVRFGNALPLSHTNRQSYPMPFCWHQQKTGEAAIQEEQLKPQNVLNYQIDTYQAGIQPVQLRNGYIALDGYVTQAQPQLRMKTAIDPSTGRASDGQLFGYTSLPQGMRFGFMLEADQDVPSQLFNQVLENIENHHIALGRSRSAEYGNVKIVKANWTFDDKIQSSEDQNKEKTAEITLWLLADLALLDEWGQPTLLPTTQHFGLPAGQLKLEKTFIRSRRYAPFNNHYCRREYERNVLNMGSVLHFHLNEPIAIQAIREKLQTGVGLYRQAGLGQIWLNPPILQTAQPSFISNQTRLLKKLKKPEKAPEPPELPLARWLLRQVGQTSQTQKIEQQAKEWIITLRLLYKSARLLASVHAGVRVGPSASQWGRVLELAKTPQLSAAKIREQLFGGDRAICKKTDPEWSAKIFLDQAQNQTQNFKQWLEQKIVAVQDDLLPTLLAKVARLAIDLAREEETKK